MPGYKRHLICGIIFSIAFYYFYHSIIINKLEILYYIPIIFFYSLLPDIYSESSIISRIIIGLFIASIIASIILYILVAKLSFLLIGGVLLIIIGIIHNLHHRGIIHTFLAGILLSLPLLIFSYIFCVFAILAFFSHIILDYF